jgi:hypothetical protein
MRLGVTHAAAVSAPPSTAVLVEADSPAELSLIRPWRAARCWFRLAQGDQWDYAHRASPRPSGWRRMASRPR